MPPTGEKARKLEALGWGTEKPRTAQRAFKITRKPYWRVKSRVCLSVIICMAVMVTMRKNRASGKNYS